MLRRHRCPLQRNLVPIVVFCLQILRRLAFMQMAGCLPVRTTFCSDISQQQTLFRNPSFVQHPLCLQTGWNAKENTARTRQNKEYARREQHWQALEIFTYTGLDSSRPGQGAQMKTAIQHNNLVRSHSILSTMGTSTGGGSHKFRYRPQLESLNKFSLAATSSFWGQAHLAIIRSHIGSFLHHHAYLEYVWNAKRCNSFPSARETQIKASSIS